MNRWNYIKIITYIACKETAVNNISNSLSSIKFDAVVTYFLILWCLIDVYVRFSSTCFFTHCHSLPVYVSTFIIKYVLIYKESYLKWCSTIYMYIFDTLLQNNLDFWIAENSMLIEIPNNSKCLILMKILLKNFLFNHSKVACVLYIQCFEHQQFFFKIQENNLIVL